MKTKLCIGMVLLAAVFARAQTTNLTALLQQGLLEEQANRNLDAAITDYQSLATQFEKDRKIAATAIFRLGECYRSLGKTNEAAAQYQRILNDFSDQDTLVTLSRQNLSSMGVTSSTMIAPESPDAALWSKVKNLPKDELPGMLPTLVPDPVLETLLQQRNETATKLAQLKVDYASENPNVVRQQTALDEINRQIDKKVVGIMQALKMRAELSPAAGPETSKEVSGSSIQTTSDEDQEIQRIQQMIQNSPDLINAFSGGSTPLVKAAYNGWIRVAAYLLDHGANVNVACFRVPGREDLLSLSDGNAAPFTPLMTAVMAGNKAMTQFLIDHGADVNFQGQNGDTPLHVAAQKGFQAVAEVLLANKADVNAQNKGGWSPLMSAASANNPEIVKLILAAGANPNVADKDGRTALSYAAENSSPEMVKMLLIAKSDPNEGKLDAPLLVAIHKNDTNSAELLLQAGANPNAKGDVDSQPSLNFQLIPNLGSNRGQATPLWLAIAMKQLPMVQQLLKYKADPNDSQPDGRPLLFNALSDTNILEALLDAGTNANVPDETDIMDSQAIKRTPLDTAAGQNDAGAVEILLKHGANPNLADARGDTALHWAAFALADEKVFALLLDRNANPNVLDSKGKTPLDYVKQALEDNHWAGRFGIWREPGVPPAQKELADRVIALLHEHGALDKLPDWGAITVSRPPAIFSQKVFQQGTNDWNQFTLLETIFNFYSASSRFGSRFSAMYLKLPFPDLAHVIIVRPNHDSTNETRMEVNLLNGTNGIDCAKDVPLQFGDVVEIPERDHALGDAPVGLTGSQQETIANWLRGKVQLVTHGQKVELTIYPTAEGSLLTSVIRQSAAQNVLLSSSDLSRVKVIRHDAKTGKQQEWIVDCSDKESSASGNPPISYQWNNGANDSSLATGLWLRDGDVIEVPERP